MTLPEIDPDPTSFVGRTRISTAASYLAILAFAFVLLFYNLDGRLFWGDEAETATLARNVLRWGVPKTFDGVNRITLYGSGTDAGRGQVWIWSPWLQEYVAAAAFSLFGPTTWAGRAFFAGIGWLALVLLARVAFRIYRDHGIAMGAAALLGTSEVFLLHARQCRYYSISVFGEILFIYAIYQMLTGSRRGQWKLTLALLLQFYSNYIIALANLPVLLLLASTLYRHKKQSAGQVGRSLFWFLMAAAPWVVYAQIWRESGELGQENAMQNAWTYLREFHFHFMPLVFLLLPLAGFLFAWWRSRRAADNGGSVSRLRVQLETIAQAKGAGTGFSPDAAPVFERHLAGLLISYAVMLLIPPGNMRYLLPLLPVVCLLTAAWLFRYIRWRAAALALILIQCLTNAVAVGIAYPWRGRHTLSSPLVNYVRGITHPYTNRLADVLGYLSREARPGEAVYVFDPEFPLIFYTQLKIIDGRLLGGRIPSPLPEWILPESASGIVDQPPIRFRGNVDLYYESIIIPVHNSSRVGSVPNPDAYEYDTAPVGPLKLYRKKALHE